MFSKVEVEKKQIPRPKEGLVMTAPQCFLELRWRKSRSLAQKKGS
jgi:hypothetical protein